MERHERTRNFMQPKEGARTSTWVFSFNYLPDKKEKIVIVSLPSQHFS